MRSLEQLYPRVILELVQNAEALVSSVAKWIGWVGAKLIENKSPDVGARGQAPSKSDLVLVDLPPEADRSLGSWIPKLTQHELRLDQLSKQSPPSSSMANGSVAPPSVAISSQSQNAEPKVHTSHDLRVAGNLVFCDACARYCTQKSADGAIKATKMLLSPCPGRLDKATGQLGRMRKGRNPTTNKWEGPVRRPQSKCL